MSLNDEKWTIKIDLSFERKTFYHKNYDITLIELKDGNKVKDYLELDNNLFQDNSEIIYKNKSIYLLHYLNEKNACVSYGLLHNIDKIILPVNIDFFIYEFLLIFIRNKKT